MNSAKLEGLRLVLDHGVDLHDCCITHSSAFTIVSSLTMLLVYFLMIERGWDCGWKDG